VLMPWIEGPTWMEVMLRGDPGSHPLTAQQGLTLAHSLTETLVGMEERRVAHCDLSGPNVMLPALFPSPAGGRRAGGEGKIALVDVEQFYGPGLARRGLLPGGSPGYAHKTAPQGLWSATADRFAGAVLLAEMLGWCDERVREAAWGESYFDPAEIQQESARYHILVQVLRERWGDSVATLFSRAWRSETLADCPSFGKWLVAPGSRLAEKEKSTMEQVQERLARASVEKADVLLEMGQIEQALEELDGAYRLAPGLVAENYARALVQQAAQREDAGDLKEALRLYQRALQVAPERNVLRREIAAIVSRLEMQLRGPVPIVPEAVGRPAVRVELPVGKMVLWLAIMLIGWAGVLILNRFTPSNPWFNLVVWGIVGALAGAAQWLAARSITSVKLWWILVTLVGWAGCWGLGSVAAGMVHPFWFVEAGSDINMFLVRNIWWGDIWHSALLLNVVFNGAAAAWLLCGRLVLSQQNDAEP